ncbi:MAG: helix-turn-helix domain-containing protein [Lachnospiraceae bacterium]|nr:helix-turn-helix domain-containing protein [Lachnospiraceae bacterium]
MRKSKIGVSVKEASQQLGYPEQAVRVLMRRGKLPIGIAERISGGERYTYYISQELIDAYLMRSRSEQTGAELEIII